MELTALLKKRYNASGRYEPMLEKGEIYNYVNTIKMDTEEGFYNPHGMKWEASSNGVVDIEIWGAGGGQPRGCCCGIFVPGNPGSYARKRIKVTQGQKICGRPGQANTNNGMSCHYDTCIGTTLNYEDGCMCAENGKEGEFWCINTAQDDTPAQCMTGVLCHTEITYGASAAAPLANRKGIIICNYFCDTAGYITSCPFCYGVPQSPYARAYGGDVNCCGGFSCIQLILSCVVNDPCNTIYYMRTPPMSHSTDGTTIIYNHNWENCFSCCDSPGFGPYLSALKLHGKHPQGGHVMTPDYGCRIGTDDLARCYQTVLPVGYPAPGNIPKSSCYSSARGGSGAIRLTFYKGEDIETFK